MRNFVRSSFMGCILSLSSLSIPMAHADTEPNLTIDKRPNGYTAELAAYDEGAFVHLSGKEWVQNTASYSFPFVETHRDEWSVYLRATDRNVRIQLDLWTMQVKYSDPSQNFVLFEITTADPDRINGWMAQKALVQDAAFVQIERNLWVQNTETYSFPFEETHRDEWSVYLKATDRNNVTIQLDYWTKEVIYRDANQEFVLDTIADAEPQRQTGWSVREVDYRGGSFQQTGRAQWSENGNFQFEETHRDEWSVYLKSSDRPGVFIQLDLWTKEVKYKAPHSNRYVVLYPIVDAN